VSPTQQGAWPTDLVVKGAARLLAVSFDDGASYDIPFELLRIESPSAQVQGHSAAQKQVVSGKADVKVVRVEPVGRYAVRLVFDDGHDSGIFTWEWLYRLGRDQDVLMAAYRAELAKIETKSQ
jgi:DUF971 family protein